MQVLYIKYLKQLEYCINNVITNKDDSIVELTSYQKSPDIQYTSKTSKVFTFSTADSYWTSSAYGETTYPKKVNVHATNQVFHFDI